MGKIRIISGKWKNRKISVPHHVRPTTDLMRETLFNWLKYNIYQARCLDCYAGTGALGLEALSRNASFVTFLELRYFISKKLSNTLLKFSSCNQEVINQNTLSWLKKFGTPYDLIFIDPPFYKKIINKTFEYLEKYNWLKSNTLIYVECASNMQNLNIPKTWLKYKEKIKKDVSYRLYIR